MGRQSEHRSEVDEVLESRNRLKNPSQIVDAAKPSNSCSPDRKHVERQAPFTELEPRQLATGEPSDQLLVHVPQRDHGRPQPVDGGLHGLGLENEDHELGLVRAEPEREGAPCALRQDGEVGGHVRGRGGERVAPARAQLARRRIDEPRQLDRGGPPHGEGLHHHLAAESDSFDVAARLETEVCV